MHLSLNLSTEPYTLQMSFPRTRGCGTEIKVAEKEQPAAVLDLRGWYSDMKHLKKDKG